MKYKIEYLPIGNVRPNPNNPRLIKDAAFKRLVKSLADCPGLFDARPLLCSNRTGDLIVLGGNMRFHAAKELKYKTVPVITMEGLTEDQEREIAIKDNGTFGEWDLNALANAWSDLPLVDWGVDLKGLDQFSPELNPEIKTEDITREEIEKEAKRLAEQMVREQKKLEVICPDCGKVFQIQT